jgi:hypothetical protein
MRFGTAKKDAVDDYSGDGLYLRTFKDGDTTVRFLEETDDWIQFREHYTRDRKSFPCTGDKWSCPGCTSDDEEVSRSSRKYACNVYVVKGGYVAPYRIPITLAKKMFTRSERNDGTVLNRDYTVMKTGKGMDTDYDVEQDDKYTMDVKTLLKDGQDIEEILQASFNEIWGSVDDPKPRANAEESKPEDLPSEAERDSDDSDSVQENVVIDEDALYDMELPDLRDLAVKAGVDVKSNARKSDVIRALLSASE